MVCRCCVSGRACHWLKRQPLRPRMLKRPSSRFLQIYTRLYQGSSMSQRRLLPPKSRKGGALTLARQTPLPLSRVVARSESDPNTVLSWRANRLASNVGVPWYKFGCRECALVFRPCHLSAQLARFSFMSLSVTILISSRVSRGLLNRAECHEQIWQLFSTNSPGFIVGDQSKGKTLIVTWLHMY